MKTTIFLSTLYLVFGVFACTKGEDVQPDINWTNRVTQLFEHNDHKLSISEGIAGTLLMRDGDCMPGGVSNSCREYPVGRKIRIYEAVGLSQAEAGENGLYNKINARLIATISTDNEGFFQYAVQPGMYSLFIEEKGKLYANGSDGRFINPVNVQAGTVGKTNLRINYATD
jgi:hypothetical protein